jgi:uncharacterized protein (DUF2164 family)
MNDWCWWLLLAGLFCLVIAIGASNLFYRQGLKDAFKMIERRKPR